MSGAGEEMVSAAAAASQEHEEGIEAEPDQAAEADVSLQSIAKRSANNAFPEVLVSEQTSLQVAQAEDLYQWALQTESSLIQSYINDRYKDFRKSCPADPEESEEVRRAKWSRSSYYKHLAECQAMAEANGLVAYFMSEAFGGEALDASSRAEVEEVSAGLALSDVSKVMAGLDAAWAKVWAELPSFARLDESSQKSNWVCGEGIPFLRKYIAAKQAADFKFVPEVPVDSLEEGPLREAAKKLIKLVQPEHVDIIKSAIEDGFAAALAKLPESMRSSWTEKLRYNFLVENYYGIVEKVLQHSVVADMQQDDVWKPTYPLESVAEVDERNSARELVRRVKAEDIPYVEAALEKAFRDALANIPAGLLEGMEQTFWQAWASESYYKVFRQVLDDRTKDAASFPGSSSLGNGSERGKAVSSTAAELFVSPKKRVRTNSTRSDQSATLFLDIGTIHKTDASQSDAYALECFVLFAPAEVSWVQVAARGSSGSEQAAVLNVLLADRTGPIILDLWREDAHTFLRDLDEWISAGTDCPMVCVRNFRISRGEALRKDAICVPPMRKISGGDRTKLSLLTAPTQSSLSNAQTSLSYDLFAKSLVDVDVPLPAVVNVAGFVGEVVSEGHAGSGVPMKTWKLQDLSGRFLEVVAHGRHADNAVMETGNQVALYFAIALEGRRGAEAKFWLFDTSHVVKLHGERRALPPARSRVQLRGKASA